MQSRTPADETPPGQTPSDLAPVNPKPVNPKPADNEPADLRPAVPEPPPLQPPPLQAPHSPPPRDTNRDSARDARTTPTTQLGARLRPRSGKERPDHAAPRATRWVPPHFRQDLSASLVVFLIAIPLSLGIALATGAPLQAGLVAAAVGGLVVGTLGGAPLQISGPAAGLTVVTADLIQTYGWRTTCAITVIAGVAQLALGSLRVARAALAVSPAIVHAMLAGIGVTVALAQLHVILGGAPEHSALANLRDLPAQIFGHHPAAAGVGLLTVVLLVGWSRLPGRVGARLRQVPAALVAVVVATLTAALLGLRVPRVDLPSWSSHALPEMPGGPLLGLAAAVLTVTLVASVESLLSAVAIDRLHHGPRANLDRELLGQGAANVLSGGLGGLPVTGVAVRSTANVRAGAVTRGSAILHGFWVLLCVGLGAALLERIPLAALAALVMVVGVQMVNIAHIRHVHRHREFPVYLATAVAVVFFGVLEGVAVGVAVAMLLALRRLARTRVFVTEESGGTWRVRVEGQLTFLAVPRLSAALGKVPRGAPAVVEVDESTLDHAAAEILYSWRSGHEARGGTAVLTGPGCRTTGHPAADTPAKSTSTTTTDSADPAAEAVAAAEAVSTAQPAEAKDAEAKGRAHHCRPWLPWHLHHCTHRGRVHAPGVGSKRPGTAPTAAMNTDITPGTAPKTGPDSETKTGTSTGTGPDSETETSPGSGSSSSTDCNGKSTRTATSPRAATGAHADPAAPAGTATRPSPQPSADPLLGGLSVFQRITAPLVRDELARLAREGQRPSHLFLTCSDSRLVTSMITSSGPGDLFTVRNIGNLVPLPDDDSGDHSVAAAIEYAVEVLGIGNITVCGHSGCGAMQAVLDSAAAMAYDPSRSPSPARTSPGTATGTGTAGPGTATATATGPDGSKSTGTPLTRWLRHAGPSLDRLRKLPPLTETADTTRADGPVLADRDISGELERLCLVNVVQQLDHLLAHECVARRVATGTLRLTGMYFDVSAAQAYVLGSTVGAFMPVDARVPQQV